MIFLYGIGLCLVLLLSGITGDSPVLEFIFYGSFILWLVSIPIRTLRKVMPKEVRIRSGGSGPNYFAEKEYGEFVISATDYMDGTEFERWCAELLSSIGAKNIILTKGSGDQGVDIIAELDGIKYAIQCKCYSKPLGNKPVQEVNAGMAYYGCQRGVVMTNNYFTSGGKQLAQAVGVELWDRNFIAAIINELENEGKEKETEIPNAYVYNESEKEKMENGSWPHQYAAEIDLEYFDSIPDIPHPDFDVIGIPRFPGIDPHDLNPESIIVVETNPFDCQADAELFSRYAEKHFKAKTWIEPRDGKYFVVIQTHVYSIQSNYREEGNYEL